MIQPAPGGFWALKGHMKNKQTGKSKQPLDRVSQIIKEETARVMSNSASTDKTPEAAEQMRQLQERLNSYPR